MTHAWNIPDLVGCNQLPNTVLTDTEITNYDIPLDRCVGCTQFATHNPNLCRFYKPAVPVITETKVVPNADFYDAFTAYLYLLYYIAMGLETRDMLYNADAGNNFIQQIATYEVVEASGNFLYLKSLGTNDPRYCMGNGTYVINPTWPQSGPHYLATGGGGALQQFDRITFDNTPLGSDPAHPIKHGRNLVALVCQSVDTPCVDCSGLGFGAEGLFTVRCFQDVSDANFHMDDGLPVTCTIWRRCLSAAQFKRIKENVPFYCSQSASEVAVADIITINKLMFHRKYTAYLDNENVTTRLLSEHRIWNDGTQTKIYLGATNWDGSSQTDLTVGKTTFKLNYYYYDATSWKAYGQKMCKYCLTTGYVKGYGKGTVDYDSSVGKKTHYCSKKGSNPSAIDDFHSHCYLYHCDNFEENDGSSVDDIVDWFDKRWAGQDWYITQNQAGSSAVANFIIKTIDNPSIMSLFGHHFINPPSSYRRKKIFSDNGKYRDKDTKGAILNDLYDFNLIAYTSGKMGSELVLPDAALGQIPKILPSYLSKPSRFDCGVLESIYWNKLLPYRKKAGYLQEYMTISGEGENCSCRGGEIQETQIYFPQYSKTNGWASNPRGTVQGGSWDDMGVSDAAGLWGLKFSINSGLPEHSKAVVSGQVFKVEREIATGRVLIHCVLGNQAVGKNIPPMKYDTTRSYREGGNIVKLADHQVVNNFYHHNTMMCDDLAKPNDLICFTIGSKLYKFNINECWACTGVEQSFTPTTYSVASTCVYPVQTSVKEPYAIETYMSPKVYFIRASLGYCPYCNKERKFQYLEDLSDHIWKWTCSTCGYKYLVADFVSTGKPPGTWTDPLMSMLYNEWYTEWDNDNQNWQLHFSPLVLNAFLGHSPPDYLLRITYVDLTGEEIYANNNDFELIQDDYNALNDPLSYLKVLSAANVWETLVETLDNDIRNWTSKYQYCKVEYGGKYWLRTHRDIHGFSFKTYFYKATVGEPSLTYYDNNILGMPGLRTGHRDWGCLSDVIYFYDDDLIDETVLQDLAFSVEMGAGIHDDSVPEVWWAEYGTDIWTQINPADIMTWKGLREIYLTKAAINGIAANNICWKIV